MEDVWVDIKEIRNSRFNDIEASVSVLYHYLKGKDTAVDTELVKLVNLVKEEKENRERINNAIWTIANKY